MHVWHAVMLFAVFVIPQLAGILIRRVKRGSERWQHRSETQQRLLSVLPGAVLAIGTLIALDVLNVLQ